MVEMYFNIVIQRKSFRSVYVFGIKWKFATLIRKAHWQKWFFKQNVLIAVGGYTDVTYLFYKNRF